MYILLYMGISLVYNAQVFLWSNKGMNFLFFTNAILLGVGLAMDAFSVSLANGLNESHMGKKRQFQISGCFSIFQTIMPLIGWFCVHTLVDTFTVFQKFIPYIALILLLFIGGNMILESFKKDDDKEDNNESLSLYGLIIQGIATSIDALSVGFTIANFTFPLALIESIIIGIVTFFICMFGLILGKKFGLKLANKANILGGSILIFIGLEIFIKSLL